MTNNSEVWMGVNGFEEYYEISNMGNIRSLYMWTGSVYHKRKEPLQLKQHIKENGYCCISLSNKNLDKRERWYVHRLVAEHFCSKEGYEDYKGNLCINHKNFDKTDNRAINLEWCTQKENNIHYRSTQRAKEDTAKRDAKTLAKNRKKSEFHKPHVKYLYENTDLTIKEISELINVGKDTVAKLLKECGLL